MLISFPIKLAIFRVSCPISDKPCLLALTPDLIHSISGQVVLNCMTMGIALAIFADALDSG